ncbi:MAG: hypothetical protein ABSD74_17510 [Rhizomicrobium sp.]|jgi:hypothetical protein
MTKHIVRLFLASALPLTPMVAACAVREPAPSDGMMIVKTIVVENTGSTNSEGWRITIGSLGLATWQSGDGTGQSMLPAAMSARLMQDIARAGSLANLPAGMCAKSVSFGTRTFMSIDGDRSPDLSCPGNAKARALEGDIETIANFLSVRTVMRGHGAAMPMRSQ